MLSDKIVQKYYSDVPAEEIEKFNRFLQAHPVKTWSSGGMEAPYISAGRGERALLTFSGGHGTPASLYHTITAFENDYRVLVIDISGFSSAGALCGTVNRILDAESIGRVHLIGQSLSGIIAQIYFRTNYDKVEKLVITNTPAPKNEKNKKWAQVVIRVFPSFLLRYLFKRELNKLAKVDSSVPPEAAGRYRFITALMNENMDRNFNNKIMMNIMKLGWEFNENAYVRDNFKGWNGSTLVITCEDDPYFKDSEDLVAGLPNADLYTFPKGMGHMAPVVHMEKFHEVIREFLGR